MSITKKEAANIGDCLDTLAFCDERIVVDCGSSDATVAIAQAKGARTVFHEWSGFGPQKNFALSLAEGDWVLSLDADERVSPELAEAIKAALVDQAVDAYEFPRLSSFCGRPMRHSGWYPDYVLRLLRRGRARFTDVIVHERAICDGVVKRLSPPLIHHPVLKLEDALSRVDRYSTASATAILASGRRGTLLNGIWPGAAYLLRGYLVSARLLDRAGGFLRARAPDHGS